MTTPLQGLTKEAWASLPLPYRELLEMRLRWSETCRPRQITPEGLKLPNGNDWIYWMLMGGRGAGKTRTGAEDMAWYAGFNKNVRCAVVAPTSADARDTCVEGVSGLINVLPASCIKNWNRSLGELVLFNDSRIKLFSAEEPERLRGPQHHRAWCDELGAWRYEETWDQLLFGLRLGERPQVVITTTPRSTKLIRTIVNDPHTWLTRESTFANEANLPESILNRFKDRYAGTRLGRQELDAEILDDVAGSLWRRSQIDSLRVKAGDLPDMARVVVGVDPATAPVGEEHEGRAETGIIIAGLGIDGCGYLLGDLSCRMSPDGWARRAISGLDMHDGDAIVAETNQGGAMVTSTIKAVKPTVKVITVHAARGKVTRAEPIAALYEQGRIKHVGVHADLEDQMVAFTSFGIEGDTTGDRVDAMVWAFSELFPRMTKKRSVSSPRVESAKEYQPHGF